MFLDKLSDAEIHLLYKGRIVLCTIPTLLRGENELKIETHFLCPNDIEQFIST